MENLKIEGTMTLPTVDLRTDGVLSITGRSIPEHPEKFYSPVDKWIGDFLETTPSSVNLLVHLDYLNTHSTECVLLLMKKLEVYSTQGNVSITWLFDEDDEDMETLGEDLDSLVRIPFEIKEVKG